MTIYAESLTTLRCDYDVNICNEAAVVTVRESFRQNYNHLFKPRYIYPLPQQASVTGMRWYFAGQWHEATVSVQPQTALGNPASFSAQQAIYLGNYPYYCDLDCIPAFLDTMCVEITYLQVMDYHNGVAELVLKNNLEGIQLAALLQQSLQADITSQRPMTGLELSSHTPDMLVNNILSGTVHYSSQNQSATADYVLRYSMDYEHPGTQAMSVFRDSTPDGLGNGYFAFYAEPDPSLSSLQIRKVYNIIIDVSGSMSGEKILQAQQASGYVVDHLNPTDCFNLTAFSTATQTLWTDYHPNTPANVAAAHLFIDGLTANGSTNIQAAFDSSVPQFNPAGDSLANIIIFMTDGEPTVGITDTQLLSAYVDSLIAATGAGICVFSFGIGTSVDEELLILLSGHNNGTAYFVGNDEIFEAVTDFYNTVCNPTLVYPQFSSIPAGAISEVYPNPAPSLFLGRQVVICGRYDTPQHIVFVCRGQLFTHEVSYQYEINLTGQNHGIYGFLPKLWAKKKIESLLVQYHALQPSNPDAIALRQMITQVSQHYHVLAIFEESGFLAVPEAENTWAEADIRAGSCFPNPFGDVVRLRFETLKPLKQAAQLRIYNAKGQLVKIEECQARTPGSYELRWEGKDNSGTRQGAGIYLYILEGGDTLVTGKLTLLR